MPYITKEERDNLTIEGSTPGQLNFIITNTCHLYLQQHGVNYKNLNEVIGVLECAKLELYATVVRTYEDKKKLENGSVSTLDA